MVGKKGVFDDSAMILAGLFVFAVAVFVLILVFRPLMDGIQTGGLFNESADSNEHKILAEGNGVIDTLDLAFVLFYIGLSLFLIISALFLDSHPAFFFIVLIIFVIVIILSAGFSNFFGELTSSNDANIINASETLSGTSYIMGHLPLFLLVTFAATGLVFFAKVRGGG